MEIVEERLSRDDEKAVDTVPKRRHVASRLVRVAPPAVLVVLVAGFGTASPSFWSSASILTMGYQAAILLSISLGMTLVILCGSIDMSVGSVALVTGSIVGLSAQAGHTSITFFIVVAILTGVACGLINGVLVAYARVPSFIVTLGTLSIFGGFGATLLNGSTVSFFNEGLLAVTNTRILPMLSTAMVIAIVLFVAGWVLTRRHRFGTYIYAIGGNEKVAVLSGVNAKLVKLVAFVLCGIGAAVAGLMSSIQLQAASPLLGSSLLLDSIAAIAIGGTSLAGGRGGVERTLLGVLILTVLATGLNQMGVPDFTQTMIKGAVVVVAATVTLAGQRDSIVK